MVTFQKSFVKVALVLRLHHGYRESTDDPQLGAAWVVCKPFQLDLVCNSLASSKVLGALLSIRRTTHQDRTAAGMHDDGRDQW